MPIVVVVDHSGFDGLVGVQDQLHNPPAAHDVCFLSVVDDFGQNQKNALQNIHFISILHPSFVLCQQALNSDRVESDFLVDERTERFQNIHSRQQGDSLRFHQFEYQVEEPVGLVLVPFGVRRTNLFQNLQINLLRGAAFHSLDFFGDVDDDLWVLKNNLVELG
jgi:hypothetical protein